MHLDHLRIHERKAPWMEPDRRISGFSWDYRHFRIVDHPFARTRPLGSIRDLRRLPARRPRWASKCTVVRNEGETDSKPNGRSTDNTIGYLAKGCLGVSGQRRYR